ncbi:MAG: glycosyltransferase family 2 protein [Deltaproteobacteria bacterium]|nr:glycosyltransferase family 2 protein [Deltaproteobacteria bacterium]
MTARPESPLISIVVPVLDEQECVAEVSRRVRDAVTASGARYEILFVDDGSRDATPDRIRQLRVGDEGVRCIRFTRSFGHQSALLAGLRFAKGDAVVTMDGDLQHPPEVLPRLIEAWRAGADVVHAIRQEGGGQGGAWKDRSSALFYRVINRLGAVPVPPGGADFRLLDRRALRALNDLPEHFAFLRGLIPWLGFPDAQVSYDAGNRFAGQSKYDLRRMVRLALDGIFSFSVVPLRLITLIGLVTTLLGVLYGVFALVAHLAGRVQTGWTSLIVLVLVFGGVQLLSLGIVSEYVGRTYEEAKRRPRYVIDRVEGIDWP